MKLKPREVKEVRERLLNEQDHICPLCGNEIFAGEDTLDHDHQTGRIRQVLHRSCNAAEGKILSWCRRSGSEDPSLFLSSMVAYWNIDWTANSIHPNHLTVDEKQLKAYRKKLKQVKREDTKMKYTKLIQDLERRIKGG